MATANPIIALVMALCMLLSPATGITTDAELPALTVSLETAEGMNLSTGITKTAAGLPVIFLDSNGMGLSLSGETSYLSDGTGTYAVSADELVQLIASSMQSIPQPTEDDIKAIAILAQGLMGGVSAEAFSLNMMGTGMSFVFDLDQLAHELHTVVPNVLTTYAAYLDPTLAKYTPYLFGEVITAEQLAQAWPQLGLDQVNTGLSAKLTMLQSRSGITFIGAVADVNFVANLREDGFSVDVTTADGTTYAFDTADVLTLVEILATATNSISSNAFSREQVTALNENYYKITTTTIKLDTAALANDLNRGLAYAIANNASTVDQLLNKYRSWIALVDEGLAAQLSAATLSQAFNGGLIELPAAKGELVVVANDYDRSVAVDGYFANVSLNGSYINGRGSSEQSASFTLKITDRYMPVIINVDYVADRYGSVMNFASNQKLFDLFRTLTISTQDRYDLQWHLSTDTNVLSADYSDEEQYMSAKIGPVNAKLHLDENDAAHFEFYAPEFFVDLHADEYGSFNVDSTIGGFEYAENYNGFTFNGYLNNNYRYRTTFGLMLTDSYRNSSMTGYLNTYDGEQYSFTMHNNGIEAVINGELYTVRALEMADSNKVGLTLSYNGAVMATLVLTNADTKITAELYQGADVTVTPYCKLTLDAAPAAFVAPADAIVVDAMTFLQKVDALF